MSVDALKPRRRWGCLTRLLVVLLFMGACYFLLLAPLPERNTDQAGETATPAPSEKVVVEGEVNPTQQAALEGLATESGGQAEVLAQNGQIQYLTVNIQVPDSVGTSAQEKASYFLQQNQSLFQVQDPSREFKIKGKTTNETGTTFVRFEQEYKGVPIYGSEAIVEVNEHREIDSVMAGYSSNLEINVQPALRSTQAEEIVLGDLGDPNGQLLIPTSLVIYDARLFDEITPNTPRLAWEVMVASAVDLSIRSYLVDAQSGEILLSLDEMIGARERNVWDIQGILVNPKKDFFWVSTIEKISKHVMNENGVIKGSNPDEDAQRAWAHAGTVYDYYHDRFDRDGLDGEGGSIEVYVNFGFPNNALWQPLYKRAFFSDGMTGLDIVAHELTHGIWTSRGIRSFNIGEAAALKESFGDIFASFIDDNDPWHITADDSTKTDPGKRVLRDLSNPTSKNYSDYNKAGNVYPNSMIHSYAVYLLSEGTPKDKPINGIEVHGIGRAKAQYIYYDVMTNRLINWVNFKEARKAAIASCKKLMGMHDITSSDCDQVMNAYAAIGIGEPAKEPVPPVPFPLPDNFGDWNSLRESLRQQLNDLLGDWSPVKLWQPFQNFIDELRNNYWVKLLECINQSDQKCVEQYLTDLLAAILKRLLQALNGTCSSIFLIPVALLLFHKWKRLRL